MQVSRAHRLRYYWTNLGPQGELQRVIQQVQRPAGITVEQVLDPGRAAGAVLVDDRAPFYCCNKAGRPREALPTLMAAVGSYSFREQGPGCVYDSAQGCWTEPNPGERELALGYAHGATAAPGVSELTRHQVTGRCMDANTAMALVALSQALGQAAAVQGGNAAAACTAAAAAAAAGGTSSSGGIGPREEAGAVGSRSINRQGYRGFLGLQVAAAVAGMQDRARTSGRIRQPWSFCSRDSTAAAARGSSAAG